MEKHKCKLCSRTFANGRSLGGHMKAHLATLPLPPKPHAPPPPLPPSSSPSHSLSSSFSSEEKALIYGLRENPKKSIRLADPESLIVLDRESETESKNTTTTSTNPTRLRSKRARTRAHRPTLKKPKPKPTPTTTEPEPASSVSDACTEEDLAMCLMMLSRDKWMRNIVKGEEEETEKSKTKKQRFDLRCDKCRKTFRSSRALESHKNVCFREDEDENEENNNNNNDKNKIFECPFCCNVFGSGQALGGHKRSHLLPSSSSSNVAINDSGRLKLQSFIDLNLPAPAEEEDEELSVVSDA